MDSKMKPSYLSLFLLFLIPVSLNAQPSFDYFPTEVGNSWLLAYIDGPGIIPDTSYTPRSIIESLIVGDSMYFLFSHPFIGGSDTVRVDLEGRVWTRHYGREDLLFDFTAGNDSLYLFPAGRNSLTDSTFYDVTVSHNLTVETYAGTFENCVSFYFDYPSSIDDEIEYIFAPDVGLIKIASFGTYGKLFAAQVGDSTYRTLVSFEEELERLSAGDFDFTVYPNPVNEKGWASVDLSKPERVEMTMFDLLGREVGAKAVMRLSAGKHQIPIDVSALPNAIYMLRITLSNQVTVGQLFVRN